VRLEVMWESGEGLPGILSGVNAVWVGWILFCVCFIGLFLFIYCFLKARNPLFKAAWCSYPCFWCLMWHLIRVGLWSLCVCLDEVLGRLFEFGRKLVLCACRFWSVCVSNFRVL